MATKKTTKQVHKGPEEVEMDLVEKAEQEKDRDCATEVEAVLKKYDRALQPYLGGGDTAIVPRLRLVRVPKEAEVLEDGEA